MNTFLRNSRRVLAALGCAFAWLAASDVLGASITVGGTVTQQTGSSFCTYASMQEDTQGNWNVVCGAGPNTITINPNLYGNTCTSYATLTEGTLGNWIVTGCVSQLAPPTVALDAPATSGASYTTGTPFRLKATASAAASLTVSKVEFFRDANVLIGQGTLSGSQYVFDWNPPAGTYSVFARATDSALATTNTAARQMIFSVPLPTATLDAPPVTGATFTAGVNYPLTGTVTVPAGQTLASVEFFRDANVLIGTGFPGVPGTGQYQFVWAPPVGTYQVFVRVTTSGGVGESSRKQMIVTATGSPPTVSLQAACTPPCVAPASVTLSGTASDPDGLAVISFFEGTTILGTASSSPFTFTVPGPINAGTHTYTAKAYDMLSSSGTASAQVVVNPAGTPSATIVTLKASGFPYANGTGSLSVAVSNGTLTGGSLAVQVKSGTTYVPYSGCPTIGPGAPCVLANLPESSVFVATNGIERSNEVTITTVLTEAPVTDSCPAESPAIGTLAGSSSVSESGAFTYSIPIAVPPGTAGMVPALGISYSSQGGNGMLGMGWSLQGLSAIYRCSKTVFQDAQKGAISYTSDDRLCLDGQRLVAVSGTYWGNGTEYRTEHDSYSRIIGYAPLNPSDWTGLTYFKVWTRSGQIRYYGFDLGEQGVLPNGANARQDGVVRQYGSRPGRDSAKSWALVRVEDRKGNYMRIYYTKYTPPPNQGVDGWESWQRPDRIEYTGNYNAGLATYATVSFGYDQSPRQDDASLYDAGSARNTLPFKLSSISTRVNAAVVKAYNFRYDAPSSTLRTVLRGVTECSGDPALCLPETRFDWTDNGGPPGFMGQGSSANFSLGAPPANNTVRVGDLNGDGISDLISYQGSGQWKVCLGSRSGLQPCTTWSTPGVATDDHWALGDLNGDGLVDLFMFGPNKTRFVCLSTGSGFNCSTWPLIGSVFNRVGGNGGDDGDNQLVGDFDGDGRVDLAVYDLDNFWNICLSNGATGFNCTRAPGPAQSNVGGPFSTIAGDFNGDGRADLAGYIRNGVWNVCFSHFGESAAVLMDCKGETPATDVYAFQTVVADFNGDGLADLVSYREDLAAQGQPGKWRVCLSKGDGTFDCSDWQGHAGGRDNNIVGDFNGDGRTDIAGYDKDRNQWSVCLATGTGFAPCTYWGVSAGRTDSDTAKKTLLGDFNGDGRTDLAIPGVSGQPDYVFAIATSAGTGAPDQIFQVTNGLGAVASATYGFLTDGASTYTKGSGASWPFLDVQSPLPVVTATASSDGIGGTYRTQISYSGLRAYQKGSGLLRFENRATTDLQTGVRTEYVSDTSLSEANANNRLWGLSKSVRRLAQGGQQIGLSNTTWGSRYQAGAYHVQPTYVTQQTWELNGTASFLTTTSSDIANVDSFGNPTLVDVRNGAWLRRTRNVYDNDVANWIIGQVRWAYVDSVTPANLSQTRTSYFEYEPGTGVLKKEVIEPGNPNTRLILTTTHDYDAYGNRWRSVVTGEDPYATGGLSRESKSEFLDGRGQFPTRITNPEGHVETHVFDPRFGVMVSVTGPNGLTTQTSLDRMGRKYCELRPDATKTRITYGGAAVAGAAMNVFTEVSDGSATRVHLDLLGREVLAETKGFDNIRWAQVRSRYNARGMKEATSRPYFPGETIYESSTLYDLEFGRPTREQAPDGAVARYSYDGATTSSSRRADTAEPGFTADGINQITKKVVDARGQIVLMTDANSQNVSFDYDPFGNLINVYKPSGTVAMQYNIRGQKFALSDPDTGSWTYDYNAAGELVNQTDANGQATQFIYDRLGRMKTRIEYQGSVGSSQYAVTNWTYDNCAMGRGKLCSSSMVGPLLAGGVQYAQNSGAEYEFDNLGRTRRVTTIVGTKRYDALTSYDRMGRVRMITYPVTGLTLVHSYNAAGYLDRITEPRTGSTPRNHFVVAPSSDGRAADGGITRSGMDNWSVSRTYDPAGRVKTSRTSYLATVQDAEYFYDRIGNLVQRNDKVQRDSTGQNIGAYDEHFCYDLLNRLTTQFMGAGVCAGRTPNTVYDAKGNITSKDGAAYTYPWAGSNRVGTVALLPYAYDSNGNVKTAGAMTVNYAPFNAPLTISRGGTTLVFTYGPEHQRLTLTEGSLTRTYVNPGSVLYEEETTAGSSVTTSYHYINTPQGVVGVVKMVNGANPESRYFAKDHLGSNVAILWSNDAGFGYQFKSVGYDAWGKRRNPDGSSQGFTIPAESLRGFTEHEMLDELGSIVHMNGRIYDAALGRFLQPDPVVQGHFSLESYNRYSYVTNNPLFFTDPSGFSRWTNFRDRILKPVAAIVVSWYLGPIAYDWIFATLTDYASVGFTVEISADTASLINGAAAVGGGAAGGFAAGGIMGGNLESAVQGALAGGLSGGVVGYYGDNYSLGRVGVESVVGGINSRIRGGSFENGLRSGFAFSALTYISVSARQFEMDGSKQVAGQIGESPGVRGIPGKLGGERINVDKWQAIFGKGNLPNPDSSSYLQDLGTYQATYYSNRFSGLFGGFQGGPGRIFGFSYAPGGFFDRVVETMGGFHDFLNHPIFYNPNGTSHDIFTSLGSLGPILSEAVNYANVFIALPVGAAAFIPDESRWVLGPQRGR